MILHTIKRGENNSDTPDYLFWCPGCKCGHGVWTSHPNGVTGATWTFNGDMAKPTFTPSVKIVGVKKNPPVDPSTGDFKRGADGEYLKDASGRLEGAEPYVCHLVVTDGVLNFCGDCTHDFNGKSVPMEDF